MRVMVNNKAVPISAEDGHTLDALLDSLRERAEIPADEVVVALEVDGDKWQADDMERLPYTPVQDVAEVAIKTAEMRAYAWRIMTDARSMLTVLLDATHELARSFQQRSLTEANAHLFHLLDALQRFLACLFRIQNICDLEYRPLDLEHELLERLKIGLDKLKSSQEREDWGALARELEEDLLPVLQDFHGPVDTMRKELSDATASR